MLLGYADAIDIIGIDRRSVEEAFVPFKREAAKIGLTINTAKTKYLVAGRARGSAVQAKILYEQMPVIYIYVINSTASKDPRLYECPINRIPQRTDKKFVGSIDCETDSSPRHWTLRGVTLLCDIK
ncbi:dynein axonemal heavy chain 8 [Culex pipiens pallens]|uniref:dynein axonemal heavy chain 8 n=1 Tax=Culex pipiens pallens TaxID=42434 RepID=UPI0019538691|nr:dynein axonemal heavy chain 8 [Culex pipiens pallens]